ncbi:zinc ribbon domain-containing protein [Orbus wheelerorum]|uniref:zinc ribbon domain-containing protein n=1 Tax=Orbus wheelerorum TaxID=3074111 RepID=UPI00370D563D
MQQKFCQSCGMPMGDTNQMYGTNKDGSKNQDYCSYCYDNGQFKYNCSMSEMITVCIAPMLEAHPEMSKAQAEQMMKQFLPTLKRWQ